MGGRTVRRTRTKDFTVFGPGSMESITLYRRTRNLRQPQVRVEGSFTVYCGMGNTHTVEISGPWDFHNSNDDWWNIDLENEARQLVEYELEDWFDPCDDGQ